MTSVMGILRVDSELRAVTYRGWRRILLFFRRHVGIG